MAYMQRQTAIKALKYIVYAGIYGGLLMPLMFVPVVIFPFVFSKLIFFQILIGLCFPAYLILAWAEPQYRPRWSLMYAAIGAYFLGLLLSTIFSVDPIRSWWGNQERMNGLFTLIHFLLWLTMTVSLIKTWAQWRNLLNYQVILGVFMACVALLQKPFPNLLLFPATARVGGLLDNPIYQGAYQIFVLFFIALLWFKTKSQGWRVWYVLAAIASFSAMLAAGSRGPFMGLILGVVLAAVTVGISHPSKKLRLTIVAVIAAALLFYGGMVTYGVKSSWFPTFTKDFPTVSRIFVLNTGTAGRFIAWNIAWQGFLERPLTGWGLDNFHVLFNTHYNPASLRSGYYETWFDRAHNTVMDVVSMTGLVGLLTFAGIWIMLYATVIRAKKKGYINLSTMAVLIGLPAGYFLQNLFVFDHPAAFSMSYLLFALVICIGFPEYAGQDADNPKIEKTITAEPAKAVKPKAIPWVTYGILQAVFMLMIYLTSVMPVYASYLTIKANTAFTTGNMPLMLELSKQAASIQTPYLDEQTFLLSRNLINVAEEGQLQKLPNWKEIFDLARQVTDRHLVAHGVNAHPRFIYANLLQSIGRATNDKEIQKQAEEQFQAAIIESPKRQQLFFGYGRLLTEMGRMDEAMQQFKTAASLDETIGEAWWYVGVSYIFDQNKPKEGAPYISRAMKAEHPYAMRNAQDALAVAQSFDLLNDKDSLKALIDVLPDLPASSAMTYVQIAEAMEHQGLIEQRNMILGAVLNLDPTLSNKLQALIDGKVKTIAESMALAVTSTQPVKMLINPTSTLSTVATATVSGPKVGPRK
jgi:O-antigen ligase/tetratricopeptide (TPR) repeat protein